MLVHLRPLPLVARVTSGAPGVDPADVVRELGVARHAATAGAPVVPPSDLLDPGPHEHAGRTLVFWTYVRAHGELDAAAAGRGLRAIHDALADYDGELGAAGHAASVEDMLAHLEQSDDLELLRELAARELPAGQALHGDAHLFNRLPTRRGPVWHDLESSCRGLREYDLAALVLRDRSREPDPAARAALAALRSVRPGAPRGGTSGVCGVDRGVVADGGRTETPRHAGARTAAAVPPPLSPTPERALAKSGSTATVSRKERGWAAFP